MPPRSLAMWRETLPGRLWSLAGGSKSLGVASWSDKPIRLCLLSAWLQRLQTSFLTFLPPCLCRHGGMCPLKLKARISPSPWAAIIRYPWSQHGEMQPMQPEHSFFFLPVTAGEGAACPYRSQMHLCLHLSRQGISWLSSCCHEAWLSSQLDFPYSFFRTGKCNQCTAVGGPQILLNHWREFQWSLPWLHMGMRTHMHIRKAFSVQS